MPREDAGTGCALILYALLGAGIVTFLVGDTAVGTTTQTFYASRCEGPSIGQCSLELSDVIRIEYRTDPASRAVYFYVDGLVREAKNCRIISDKTWWCLTPLDMSMNDGDMGPFVFIMPATRPKYPDTQMYLRGSGALSYYLGKIASWIG